MLALTAMSSCKDQQAGPLRPALRAYVVPLTGTPPAIDGDLSDSVWRQSPAVELVNSITGRKGKRSTLARILYDDHSLYLCFQSQSENVWATLTQRDEALYEEEVVEIFIDANADGKTYNEIEVSPRNVLFDAYFPARRQGMDLQYDSGTRSAVVVRGTLNLPIDIDQGWNVEMAIPFSSLSAVNHVPPRSGEKWRFNLYRLDHADYQVEGLAFSPPQIGDFHALDRFGWLIFQ